jgi:putative spermidine/putrescine transport system substrate-binding protein
MIAAHAAHPNCMYKWMDWIVSPKANAMVAESFGEAPAQTKSCALTAADKKFCDSYHALDANYASKIYYWTTPQKQCVDGSGDNCTDYSEWVTKWLGVKG